LENVNGASKQRFEQRKSKLERFDSGPILYKSRMAASNTLASTLRARGLGPGPL